MDNVKWNEMKWNKKRAWVPPASNEKKFMPRNEIWIKCFDFNAKSHSVHTLGYAESWTCESPSLSLSLVLLLFHTLRAAANDITTPSIKSYQTKQHSYNISIGFFPSFYLSFFLCAHHFHFLCSVDVDKPFHVCLFGLHTHDDNDGGGGGGGVCASAAATITKWYSWTE